MHAHPIELQAYIFSGLTVTELVNLNRFICYFCLCTIDIFIIYIFVAKISVLICDLLLTKFKKKLNRPALCALLGFVLFSLLPVSLSFVSCLRETDENAVLCSFFLYIHPYVANHSCKTVRRNCLHGMPRFHITSSSIGDFVTKVSHTISVCLSVCPSRSHILSRWMNHAVFSIR